MIHEEKKLRARMRLLAIVAGLLFVVGIVAVFLHINSGKLWNGVDSKRAKPQDARPAR